MLQQQRPQLSYEQLIQIPNVCEVYPALKTRPSQLWQGAVEDAFQRAVCLFNVKARVKLEDPNSTTKYFGRNDLIAKYIWETTGEYRTKNQVAGHMRQIRKKKKEHQRYLQGPESILEQLINSDGEEESDIDQHEAKHMDVETIPTSPTVLRRNNTDYESVVQESEVEVTSLVDLAEIATKQKPTQVEVPTGRNVDSVATDQQHQVQTNVTADQRPPKTVTPPPLPKTVAIAEKPVRLPKEDYASPLFLPRCIVHRSSESRLNVAHLSAPFIQHPSGTKTCHFVTVFHSTEPVDLELTTSVASFGKTILCYKQYLKSEWDPILRVHLIYVNNNALDDFLHYFVTTLLRMENGSATQAMDADDETDMECEEEEEHDQNQIMSPTHSSTSPKSSNIQHQGKWYTEKQQNVVQQLMIIQSLMDLSSVATLSPDLMVVHPQSNESGDGSGHRHRASLEIYTLFEPCHLQPIVPNTL